MPAELEPGGTWTVLPVCFSSAIEARGFCRGREEPRPTEAAEWRLRVIPKSLESARVTNEGGRLLAPVHAVYCLMFVTQLDNWQG